MNFPSDGRALIDGRSAFNDAVRDACAQALHARERELCFSDVDFLTWPLDDADVLAALAAWARLPQRRLVLVASSFDALPRRFARFTEFRRTWAHVVEAHVTDVEPSQVPTLLLAGRASVMLSDRLRWRGHRLELDDEVAAWREVLDVLLQRSEPGFGANTLGL
jgi:pimeloyl-ACP methyl ester carboxylesterase